MIRALCSLGVCCVLLVCLWKGLTLPPWSLSVRFFVGVYLPPAALGIFLCGILWRVWRWAVTPVPYPIALTCGQQLSLPWIKPARLRAPASSAAVAGRLVVDALFFLPLLRHTRARFYNGGRRLLFWPALGPWCTALLFHYCLLIVVVRHTRLFFDPVPGGLQALMALDGWLQVGFPRWWLSGFALMAALWILLARRVAGPVLRRISLVADYMPLYLFLALAGSGMLLRYVDRADMTAVKIFLMNLPRMDGTGLAALPPLFLLHMTLACILLMIIPVSKLTHGLSLFFTPTLALRADSRSQNGPGQPKSSPKRFAGYAAYERRFAASLVNAGLPLDGCAPEMERGSDVFKGPAGASAPVTSVMPDATGEDTSRDDEDSAMGNMVASEEQHVSTAVNGAQAEQEDGYGG